MLSWTQHHYHYESITAEGGLHKKTDTACSLGHAVPPAANFDLDGQELAHLELSDGRTASEAFSMVPETMSSV